MKNTYNIIQDASVEILRQLKGQQVEGISVEQTDTLEHTLSQYEFRDEWSSHADDDDTIYQSKTEHQAI